MLIIGRHLGEKHWPELLSARRGFYACAGKIEDEIRAWPGKHKALIDGKLTSVEEELAAVMPYVDSLGRGLRGNPRQIKRFLNIISLRRRLATENDLDVKQDLLIKLAVLEYVWEEFFNAVVETVDPATGHSALIEEVLKAAETGDGHPEREALHQGRQHKHRHPIRPGGRLGLVIVGDEAADRHTREVVQKRQHGVEHLAADVLEVDVDPRRAGGFQPLRRGGLAVVEAGVESEFLPDVAALPLPPGDADSATAGARGEEDLAVRRGHSLLLMAEPSGALAL
jgi:hypothetical protein